MNPHDSDGTVTSVAFYLETTSDTTLETGTDGDQLLGTATAATNWTLSVSTANLPLGSDLLYAQATDDSGAVSTPLSASATINPVTTQVHGPSGVPILNGEAAPVTADDTDFGTALVGGTPITKTFTIQNTGSATLNLTGSPLVASSNTSDFTITQPAASSLAPGASTTFQLTFAPGSGGAHGATLTIPTDSADADPFTFEVQGVGSAEQIIDDSSSAGYSTTGSWTTAVDPHNGLDGGYSYAAAGDGSQQANWTFTDLAPGQYQVSATWVPNNTNRATNAPYSLYDGSTPLTTVAVNQQLAPSGLTSQGAAWQTLATVTVTSGTLTVQLSNDADNYVIADAIRLVGPNLSSQVQLLGASGASIIDGETTPIAAGDTNFGAATVGGAPLTKTFTIQNTGLATLNLTGSPLLTVSNSSDFSVSQPAATSLAPGASTSFQVTFAPSSSGSRSATITIPTDDPAAEPFVFDVGGTGNVEQIIDDSSSSGYSTTGGWTTAVDPLHGLDGGYSYAGAGDGSQQANWTFTGLAPGQYQVSTTWVAYTNRASNAPFSIYDGSTLLDTVPVNQQLTPVGVTSQGVTWQTLATVTVTSGTLTVRLDNNADNYVIADAVRIVGDQPAGQMQVTGPSGVSIPDGDATSSLADDTNIGTALVGGSPITKTYTIENVGSATLNLTGSPLVSISGASDFAVTQPAVTSLAPGASTTFQVTFTPTAAGIRTATLTIPTDNDAANPFTLQIAGTAGLDQVIDDSDSSGFSTTGGWSNLGATNVDVGLNGNYQYAAAGDGSSQANWTFTDLPPGQYQVSATWVASFNRATNSPYSIYDGSTLLGTIPVNQLLTPSGSTSRGVSWQTLETVNVTSGTLTVRLSNDANSYVIADGVRIVGPLTNTQVFGPGNAPILNDEAAPSATSGTDLGTVLVGGTQITKTYTIANNGSTAINLTGSPLVASSNSSEFTVTQPTATSLAPGASTTFQVTFAPSSSGVQTAVITIPTDSPDASPFTFEVAGTGNVQQIIDDSSTSGYSTVGGWTTAVDPHNGLDGGYSYAGAGDGSQQANWTFTNLPPGQYQVSTTWVASFNRATNSPYSIYDGSTLLSSAAVNQQLTPVGSTAQGVTWQSLATVTVNSGTLRVSLSNNANNYVIADAVRILGPNPLNQTQIVGPSNVAIADGEATPQMSDDTDFGSAILGGAPITKTFTIQNTGGATLNLTGSPLVSAAGAADFTVTQPAVSTLAPGASTTFQVTFAPSSSGLQNATLTIPTDDANADPFTFAIQGTGNIAVTSEQIIDDSSSSGFSATGGWSNLGATNVDVGLNGNYQYAAAGDGSQQANWTFTNLVPGQYQVSATWVAYSNRATNSPFSLYDGSTLLGTSAINQQLTPAGATAHGVTWQVLNTVTVDSGTLTVRLSNNANGYVIADAVRIIGPLATTEVFGPSNVPIVEGETTPNAADDTDLGSAFIGGSPITTTFTIQNTGAATINLTGSPLVASSNPGDFTVTQPAATSLAPGASTTFQVTFAPGASGLRTATVTIPTDHADANPFTFAVQGTGLALTNSEHILDDSSSSGYSTTGGWTTAVDPLHGLDGGYSYAGAGDGSQQANWTFTNLAPGQYQVSATWVPNNSNRATNAPYSLYDGSTLLDTVTVNQQLAPAGVTSQGVTWQTLETVTVTSGTLTVQLSNNANNYVIADGIRIIGVGSPSKAQVAGPSNVLITNGETSASSTDGTDFGSAIVGGSPITKTFTVQNAGGTTLNLTGSPVVTSTDSNDFTITQPAVSTLAPGASTTFQITFAPSTTGLLNATVTIPTDDVNASPFTFEIQGTGNAATTVEQVIDDSSSSGYSTTGSWTTAVDPNNGLDGGYSYAAAGDGSQQANWTFSNLPAGVYQVSATWVAYTNRATNSPYSLYDGQTLLGTVPVNQQLVPSGITSQGVTWQTLETVTVTSGTLTVGLSNNANNYVIADAVRIVGPLASTEVFGPSGTPIADGETTPSTTDDTDIGVALVGGIGVTKTFTIQNTGTTTLNLTGSPVVVSSSSSEFTIAQPAVTSLAPGASTTFQVTFAPNSIGTQSATLTIPTDNPEADPFTFEIEGTGSTTTNLEQLVDDTSTSGYSTTGNWSSAGATDGVHGLNGEYQYAAAGDGSQQATWTFTGLTAGQYQVSATWVPFTNRATNAPYSLYDGSTLLETVPINQELAPSGATAHGVTWQTLETVTVTSGTLTVVLSNNANSYVIADAIRIVGPNPSSVVKVFGAGDVPIANGESNPSTADDTDFGTALVDGIPITKTFTIQNNGSGVLNLTGSPLVTSNNASDFSITQPAATSLAPGASTTFQVTFAPGSGGVRSATLTIPTDNAIANPFTFDIHGTGSTSTNVQRIVDDTGPGYSVAGNWTTAADGNGFNGDYQYAAAGDSSQLANWTFINLIPGVYQVSTTWVAYSNRATNAPYSIYDGATLLGTVAVNQQLAPAGVTAEGTTWQTLETVTVTSGTLTVLLRSNANNYVIADAVRIVGPAPQQIGPILVSTPAQSVYLNNTLNFTAQAIERGATLTYSLGSDAPIGATINAQTGVFSWTPTGITPGTYSATVIATDDGNGHPVRSASQAVTINVLARQPQSLSIGGPSTSIQGFSYPLSLSGAEPDGDTITGWTIEWGDGTAPQAVSGNPSSVSHIFGPGPDSNSNNYTITATATDQDGTYTAGSQTVTVSSAPPTVMISGASTVNQGVSYPLTLSAIESDGETITGWTINWGDGTAPQAISGNPPSVSHVFGHATGAGSSYTVAATASDDDYTATSNSLQVAVTAFNNAPVLTRIGFHAQALPDTSQSPNLGLLVSALTAGISDLDSGAQKGIAIIGTDQAHGTIQYSTDGGASWNNVGTVSTANALLLPANANTRVRLLPTDTFSGTTDDAITFRAWDLTSGTAYNYANTTTGGGTSAFSTAIDTVSMTINSTFGAALQVSGSYPVGTAVDAQGNTLVAWVDEGTNALMAQSYLVNGTPMGSPFQVTPQGISVQSAALTMNANGTILFVWTAQGGNGAYEVLAQRFDNSTDQPIDTSPTLLSIGGLVPANLTAGIASSGGFAVAYDTDNGTASQAIVLLYNADNQPQGSPITVATQNDPSTVVPALSMAADGSFTVAWTSSNGTDYQVQALRYNADGTFRDGSSATPIQVVAQQTGLLGDVSIAQQSDGGFVVAWNDQNQQAWVQHYDAQLNPSTAIALGVVGSSSRAPALAIDPDDSFEVLWTDSANVWTQFFSSTGQSTSGVVSLAAGVDPPETLDRTAFLASSGEGTAEALWYSSASNSTAGEGIQTPALTPNSVVGRYVFYNDSVFDGINSGADANDDNAIAPDKTALLPGQTATFANYTSYVGGINGIAIDITDLPSTTLSASDFEFRVGNNDNTSDWAAAPAPLSITVVPGDGVGGSDRVKIIWANGSITDQWLQITVQADAATGLTQPDVFYFGNAVGSTGTVAGSASVGPADETSIVNSGIQNNVPITSAFDINRDGTINATDEQIVTNQVIAQAPTLQLITPTPVDISIGNETALSGSTSLVFPVTLSAASSQIVTVAYSTSNGTATAPGVYTAENSTLEFLPGTTTLYITVPINGTAQFASAETFNINLSNPQNAGLNDSQAVGTIDAPPHISIGDETAAVGSNSLVFPVTLSTASTQTVTLAFSTANGTATAPGNYAAESGTLTFQPGVTTEYITVALNSAAQFSGAETFSINLSNPQKATFSDSQAIGTIDPPPGISIGDETAPAGSTSLIFPVALSTASSQTITLAFSTANGTATAPGNYTAESGTLTFQPGVTTQDVTVSLNSAAQFSGAETFSINLSNPQNAALADSQAIGTIDPPPGISIGDAAASSHSTSIVFPVTLSTASSQAIVVTYSTANGTATATNDYTAASNSLTFQPGVTTQYVTVALNATAQFSGAETFFVNLTNPQNATLTDSQATGTIDLEPGISIGDATALPTSTSIMFPVTLSTTSSQTITVAYSTADYTAEATGRLGVYGSYTSESGTLTFLPGVTTQYIAVPVFPPTMASDIFTYFTDTTFFVNLTSPQNATLTDAQGVGTIDELVPSSAPDPGYVGAGFAYVGSTSVTFPVVLTNASNQAVALNYFTFNGAVSGNFYTPAEGEVVFPPGSTTQYITVALNPLVPQPPTYEGPGFYVILGDQQFPSGYTDAPAYIDELPDLSVGDETSTAGSTSLVFPVFLSPASNQTVTVTYSTPNFTATAPADFTAETGTLTFQPGVIAQYVTVPINAAAMLTTPESFYVELSGPQNATADNAFGVGTIEPPIPGISIGDETAVPGSTSLVFPVTLSATGSQAVTIDYSTADGSAAAGTNYTAESGTLTFQPGTTTLYITVPLNGAAQLAAPETFSLNLTNPQNAALIDSQATGTIAPPPNISISDEMAPVGSTSLVFPVTLSSASSQIITVAYATANGTATASTNYTAESSTLTFQPGITTQYITVAINGAAQFSGAETFSVNLSNPQDATLADSQATGTIDPPPGISIGDATALPGSTSITFSVNLSTASSQTITVAYSTANGTATASTNYTTESSTITFQPGVTTQSITVPLNAAAAFVGAKTFSVNLSSPQDATLADSQAIGTIDPPPGISIGGGTVQEGAASLVFTVSLSTASSQQVTVAYATANGTATPPIFTAGSGTLTFAPGVTSQNITVPLRGNVQFSVPETFYFNLTSPQNATLTESQAAGTVVPELSIAISNASAYLGSTSISFPVTLSVASTQTVSVNFYTVDGSATAGTEYTSSAGAVTFPPGTTTQNITIQLLPAASGAKTFWIILDDPQNATLPLSNYGLALGTIDVPNPNGTAPTITLTSSANPMTYGSGATLTATITPPSGGGPAPTGTVSFVDTSTDFFLGGSTVSANGTASLTLSNTLPIGIHPIVATYSGDANYAPLVADLSETVVAPSSGVILTSSNNPSQVGQQVILTAQVIPTGSNTATPTGYVNFLDGTTLLNPNPIALSSGTASLATSNLSVGTHSLTVQYLGVTATTSNVVAQIVNSVQPSGATITANEDGPDQVISLAKLFGDSQSDPNHVDTYAISSGGPVLPITNPSLLSAVVVGSDLQVHFKHNVPGTSDITVIQQGFGGTILQTRTVSVQVNAVSLLPTIGSLTTGGPNVVQGLGNLVLTASGISAPDGTVTSVEFYRDARGTGIFDPSDPSIGAVSSASGGNWTLNASTASLPAGPQIYFARAFLADGSAGPAATVTGTVESPNPVLDPVPVQNVALGNDGYLFIPVSGYSPIPTAALTYWANPQLSNGLTLVSGATNSSSAVASGDFVYQLPTDAAVGSTYTVTLNAKDAAGRMAAPMTVTVDVVAAGGSNSDVAPQIELRSDSEGEDDPVTPPSTTPAAPNTYTGSYLVGDGDSDDSPGRADTFDDPVQTFSNVTNGNPNCCGCPVQQVSYNDASGTSGLMASLTNEDYMAQAAIGVIADVEVQNWTITTPTTFSATLVIYGLNGQPAYTGAPVWYQTEADGGSTFHLTLEDPNVTLPTGRYRYDVQINVPGFSGIYLTESGFSNVVNETNTAYGTGWSLDNVDRLYLQSDANDTANNGNLAGPLASLNSGALLVTGAGQTYWFESSVPDDSTTVNPNDFQTDITDPNLQQLVKNTNGSYTLTSKDGSQELFAPSGVLTAKIDPYGNATTYAYNNPSGTTPTAANLLTSITDPLGHTTTYSYNSSGLLTTITDYLNRQTTLSYQSLTTSDGTVLNTLTEVISPPTTAGSANTDQISTYHYDPITGYMDRTTTPDGNVSYFHYDAAERLASITTGDGTQELGLHASEEDGLALLSGLGTSSSNPMPVLLQDGDAGRVGYRVDASGNITSFTTDAKGNIISQTDALGNTTTWQRNGAGQVTLERDPALTPGGPAIYTQYTYDMNCQLTEVADVTSTGAVNEILAQYAYTVPSTTDPTNASYPDDATSSSEPSQVDALTQYMDAYGNITNYTVYHIDPITGQTVLNPGGEVTAVTQISSDPSITPTKVTHYTYTTANQFTPAGLVQTMTDPNGNTTTYSYEQNTIDAGELASQTLTGPGGSGSMTITYGYDAQGNPNTVTDESGTTQYGYDNIGRVTSMTDALGDTTKYTYDNNNNVTSVTAPDGSVTQYIYQAGLLAQEVDPSPDRTGNTAPPDTIYTYTPDRQVASVTDPRGNTTNYTYDAVGNMRTETDPAGSNGVRPLTQYSYDTASDLTSITDPNGNVTGYQYDDLGRVTGESDPDPANPGASVNTTISYPTTTLTVDGNPGTYVASRVTVTDPLSNSTTYNYDSFGDLASVDAPPAQPGGPDSITSYTYDGNGNLLSQTVTNKDGSSIGGVVGPSGSAVTSLATSYSYDFRDRLTSETDPANQNGAVPFTQYTYSLSNGADTNDLQSVTDPLGQTTTYTYDALDRVQTATAPVPATGQVAPKTTYYYDSVGNLVAASDAMNHTSASVYDPLGQDIADVDPDGNTTSYTYDADGNLTSLTDPDGNTTSYAYNALDQVKTESRVVYESPTAPNVSVSESFLYDANGNLSSQTDFDGRTTSYTYNGQNQLLTATGPTAGGTEKLSYTYDHAGNLLTADDSTTIGGVTTAGPQVTYGAYNDYGQSASETEATPGVPSVKLASSYNTLWERTGLAATIGSQADFANSYQYDSLGNMTQVTQQAQGTAAGDNAVAPKAVTFGYDALGQLKSIDRYAGQSTTAPLVAHTQYSYDADGRVTDITDKNSSGGILDEFIYGYDSASRLTTFNSTADNAVAYSYDPAGQLTFATYSDTPTSPALSTTAYNYDANGNRTSVVTTPTGGLSNTAASTTGTDNELASDGTYDYTYDAQGNLSTATSIASPHTYTTYAYDFRNDLVGVTTYTSQGGTVTENVTYTYDALGRRIGEVASGTTNLNEHFVYDGNQIVLQFNGSGPITDRYLYGALADQVLADEQYSSPSAAPTSAGNVQWPLDDAEGSVRDLVDSSGSVIDHINYDAFGNALSPPNAAVDYLFGYTGFINDLATGDLFSWSRPYIPTDGNWAQQDFDGFGGGQANLDEYVGNAPTNATDPSGQWTNEDEVGLRNGILQAISENKLAQGAEGDKRNPKYWVASDPTDPASPFAIKADVTDPLDAIDDVFSSPPSEYDILCNKAAELVIVKGFINYFRSTNNEQGLAWVRNVIEKNNRIPTGDGFMKNFVDSYMRSDWPTSALKMADQVWFNNKGTPQSGRGNEGCNAFFYALDKFQFANNGDSPLRLRSQMEDHTRGLAKNSKPNDPVPLQRVRRAHLPASFDTIYSNPPKRPNVR